MNTALKIIIETAMKYENNDAIRSALDEIYVNLIIRPIQLAWIRSKIHTDNYSCDSADTWGPK
jgi:hypothetical protein